MCRRLVGEPRSVYVHAQAKQVGGSYRGWQVDRGFEGLWSHPGRAGKLAVGLLRPWQQAGWEDISFSIVIKTETKGEASLGPH